LDPQAAYLRRRGAACFAFRETSATHGNSRRAPFPKARDKHAFRTSKMRFLR
jgi:hypothetical protein